jgi:hypothetical protein
MRDAPGYPSRGKDPWEILLLFLVLTHGGSNRSTYVAMWFCEAFRPSRSNSARVGKKMGEACSPIRACCFILVRCTFLLLPIWKEQATFTVRFVSRMDCVHPCVNPRCESLALNTDYRCEGGRGFLCREVAWWFSFNTYFFSVSETGVNRGIRKLENGTYLHELDVRKPLVVSISHKSEYLRLYNP